MMGGSPRYLSAGFILEEGLPIATLKHVVSSMAKAAQDCGVQIVCGDTKVVDRGKGDQIFINTTGLGVIPSISRYRPSSSDPWGSDHRQRGPGRTWHRRVKPARRIRIFREPGQRFRTTPYRHCRFTQSHGISIHCLRDLTRGGLASALNELATSSSSP